MTRARSTRSVGTIGGQTRRGPGHPPVQSGGTLLSLILELPVSPGQPPELSGPRFALLHGRRGELRAGWGRAAEWRAAGPSRLPELRARARSLAAGWRQWDPDETGFGGFALVGFAADPGAAAATANPIASHPGLPNALLWVPELALISRGGQAALILTTPLPAALGALRTRWREWLGRLVPGRPSCPAAARFGCPGRRR